LEIRKKNELNHRVLESANNGTGLNDGGGLLELRGPGLASEKSNGLNRAGGATPLGAKNYAARMVSEQRAGSEQLWPNASTGLKDGYDCRFKEKKSLQLTPGRSKGRSGGADSGKGWRTARRLTPLPPKLEKGRGMTDVGLGERGRQGHPYTAEPALKKTFDTGDIIRSQRSRKPLDGSQA